MEPAIAPSAGASSRPASIAHTFAARPRRWSRTRGSPPSAPGAPERAEAFADRARRRRGVRLLRGAGRPTPRSTWSTSRPRTRCTSTHARLAFEAGKHVLCEKPMTLNAAETEEMVAAGPTPDRFLMEAMWTACHPIIRRLGSDAARRAARHPAPGARRPRLRVEARPSDRLLDPALGARRAARHGHLPAHPGAPAARRGRGACTRSPSCSEAGIDLDVASTGRYPGGATGHDDGLDDLLVAAGRRRWPPTSAGSTSRDFHHPTHATFTPYAADGSNDPDGAASPCDRARRAGDRPRLRQRDRRGAPVPARRAARRARWCRRTRPLTLMRQMDDLRGADRGAVRRRRAHHLSRLT